jgi:hypothetical protein
MGAGAGNFSPHHNVQTGPDTHPASYPMGTKSSSVGVKRQGREADHLPVPRLRVSGAIPPFLHTYPWGRYGFVAL